MRRVPFTVVSGLAIPLLRSNVDTDTIIPMERMLATERAQLGRHALETLRQREDGSEDPNFVLNEPRYAGAPILLAGENFGSGSSREPAVWALQGLGLRCVVAPSFGEIFAGNCYQNGVLPLVLPAASIAALVVPASAGEPLTIDLVRSVVSAPGLEDLPFEIDRLRREALLSGLDEIGLTLRDEAGIRAWQRADRVRRPWIWEPIAC